MVLLKLQLLLYKDTRKLYKCPLQKLWGSLCKSSQKVSSVIWRVFLKSPEKGVNVKLTRIWGPKPVSKSIVIKPNTYSYISTLVKWSGSSLKQMLEDPMDHNPSLGQLAHQKKNYKTPMDVMLNHMSTIVCHRSWNGRDKKYFSTFLISLRFWVWFYEVSLHLYLHLQLTSQIDDTQHISLHNF